MTVGNLGATPAEVAAARAGYATLGAKVASIAPTLASVVPLPASHEKFLTAADVVLTGDGTTWDPVLGIMPPAGDYLVTARLSIYAATNDAACYAARLSHLGIAAAESDLSVPAGGLANLPYHSLVVQARVTLDGVTAVWAEVASNKAGIVVKSAWQASMNKATSITALRIATPAYFIGSSITVGWDGAAATGLYPNAMSARMGWSPTVDGVGGSGYIQAPTFASRLAAIIAANPPIVVVEGGINDCGGYPNLAAPIAAMQTFLADLRAGLPAATIFVTASHQAYPEFEAAVLSATVGIVGIYVTWFGWLTGTGNVGAPVGDGNRDLFMSAGSPHLTAAGYAYVGNRFAAAIAPW